MKLRIERISGKGKTRIRLSGTFRSEHVDEVKAEIVRGGPRVALDLEEVGLIGVEGVRFLNRCEADGISRCCTVRLTSGSGCSGNKVVKRAHE